MIEVFKTNSHLFGFEHILSDIPSKLLVVLLLVSLGLAALKRMENFNLEGKLYYFVVLFIVIGVWPTLLQSIKSLIDAFNTYLIQEVFHIKWDGLESVGALIWKSVEFKDFSFDLLFVALTKILAVVFEAARLVLYFLYLVFYFYYLILGPLVLARGILSQDFKVLEELLKEVTVLFLWQTTFVFLLGIYFFSFTQSPGEPDPTIVQLAKMVVIIVAIIFVPFLTRKFASDLAIPAAQSMMSYAGGLMGGGALMAAQKVGGGGSALLQHGGSKTASHLFPIAGGKLTNAAEALMKSGESSEEKDVKGGSGSSFLKRKAAAVLQKSGSWLSESPLRDEAKRSGIEVPTAGDALKRKFSVNPAVQRGLIQKESAYQRFKEIKNEGRMERGSGGSTLRSEAPPLMNHQVFEQLSKEPISERISSNLNEMSSSPASPKLNQSNSKKLAAKPSRMRTTSKEKDKKPWDLSSL